MDDATLTLDEAVATASTGDVWLFRGRSLADVAIRALTNSPVNHVGMVVALDDLPPLMWHAELGKSLPDVWTGERQRGVQLHMLGEAVSTWNERYGQRAWVRHLEGRIEREHEDRLMEIVERFDGRPFPTTPGLIRQWATGRYRRRESSLETIYCAELVATTFQHMGLLPKRRPASWYDPGRFWSGDRIEMVPPFALGGEIPVRADVVAVEGSQGLGSRTTTIWRRDTGVKVRDAMTEDVLTITPGRSLREAAKFMTENNVGALVIIDPEQPGPGIVTERDLVRSLGSGEDPDTEMIGDHLTAKATFADGDWSLQEAADAMAAGGFRHLVVVSHGEVEGIISMRDIIHVWRPS